MAVHRTILLLGVVLFVQGCAISHLTSGFGSSVFGSSSSKSPKKTANTWNPTVTEERLLAAAKTDPDGPADIPTTAKGCPKFVVWPRDRYVTTYEAGRAGDGLAIVYRGEITKTARECEISPNGRITVKYGFAGRVLLGPKGKPGSIKLPVLVHVTNGDRDKVNSDKVGVAVTVSPDKPIGYFSLVRRVTFDLTPGTLPSDYKLFVAFDRKDQGGRG